MMGMSLAHFACLHFATPPLTAATAGVVAIQLSMHATIRHGGRQSRRAG